MDLELAWMAGIVDGEGTITLSRQLRKNRVSPAYRSCVTVTNTDFRLVQPFADRWGGGIYLRPDKRKEKNWKASYTWHCPHSSVEQFLHAILPLLRGKAAQARLIIEFQERRHSYPRQSLGQGKGSAPLGQQELEYRESIWNQIRLLNEKGRYSRANREDDAICMPKDDSR